MPIFGGLDTAGLVSVSDTLLREKETSGAGRWRGPKPPPRRIPLGSPALAAAREVWVLASGEGKAGALRDSLAIDSDTPLGRVLQSREQTEILTDFEV